MHKGIAIAFLKAIGFCNKPKRTIFVVCRGDPFNGTVIPSARTAFNRSIAARIAGPLMRVGPERIWSSKETPIALWRELLDKADVLLVYDVQLTLSPPEVSYAGDIFRIVCCCADFELMKRCRNKNASPLLYQKTIERTF